MRASSPRPSAGRSRRIRPEFPLNVNAPLRFRPSPVDPRVRRGVKRAAFQLRESHVALTDASAVKSGGFFSAPLNEADPAVFASIRRELERQQGQIELIASENIVSKAVLE